MDGDEDANSSWRVTESIHGVAAESIFLLDHLTLGGRHWSSFAHARLAGVFKAQRPDFSEGMPTYRAHGIPASAGPLLRSITRAVIDARLSLMSV